MKQLSAYKLETENRDGKRLYQTPDGKLYPSVSTILNQGNFGVLGWRKKLGKEEANRRSKEACQRGSRLHAMIHSYFASGRMPGPGFEWFDKVKYVLPYMECLLAESSIWNDEQEYAGTFDLLCKYRGKITIVDWKTSKAPKSIEMCNNHFAQVAAYAKGIELVYQVPVEAGAVIVINGEEEDIQEFSLDKESLSRHFDVFCSKNKTFKEYDAKRISTASKPDVIANIPTWSISSIANFNHCPG